MKSVYVGNLPYSVTEEEIKELFAPFGEVQDVKLVSDRETRRPKGYGFVQIADAAAQPAIQALDGQQFGGRRLRVNEARERAERPQRHFEGHRGPGSDYAGHGNGEFHRPKSDFQHRNEDRPRDSYNAPRNDHHDSSHDNH